MQSFKYNSKNFGKHSYVIPSQDKFKFKLDMIEYGFDHCDDIKNLKSDIDIARYPSSTLANILKNKICNYVGLSDIYCNNIILTHGSDNALKLCLDMFLTNESKVLLLTPTYPHFEQMLNNYQVLKIDKHQLNFTMSNTFISNKLCDMLCRETYDLVYIVNPNMPIGYSISYEVLELLVKNNKSTVFIIDEAYIEFSEEKTCAKLAFECTNLVVIKTFSKFFGIASMRIGYMICNDFMLSLATPYVNTKDVTDIAVLYATTALDNVDHYVNNAKIIKNIKEYLDTRLKILLKKNDFYTNYSVRDGLFFSIFCKDPEKITKYLVDIHKIYIRNKHSEIEGCIRIAITKKDILDELIDILENYQT